MLHYEIQNSLQTTEEAEKSDNKVLKPNYYRHRHRHCSEEADRAGK